MLSIDALARENCTLRVKNFCWNNFTNSWKFMKLKTRENLGNITWLQWVCENPQKHRWQVFRLTTPCLALSIRHLCAVNTLFYTDLLIQVTYIVPWRLECSEDVASFPGFLDGAWEWGYRRRLLKWNLNFSFRRSLPPVTHAHGFPPPPSSRALPPLPHAHLHSHTPPTITKPPSSSPQQLLSTPRVLHSVSIRCRHVHLGKEWVASRHIVVVSVMR